MRESGAIRRTKSEHLVHPAERGRPLGLSRALSNYSTATRAAMRGPDAPGYYDLDQSTSAESQRKRKVVYWDEQRAGVRMPLNRITPPQDFDWDALRVYYPTTDDGEKSPTSSRAKRLLSRIREAFKH
ncbi:Hypothetical predicted protein [Lecanosticta acicola]|uniref:Uncharacterized protein n=1 Tax=Lecanosticta acicola TaxID=111012 RepID=A0AAI8Z3R2_9PEZI|nr:Hypothetical predicted protein [Lecanosticta acicola]